MGEENISSEFGFKNIDDYIENLTFMVTGYVFISGFLCLLL